MVRVRAHQLAQERLGAELDADLGRELRLDRRRRDELRRAVRIPRGGRWRLLVLHVVLLILEVDHRNHAPAHARGDSAASEHEGLQPLSMRGCSLDGVGGSLRRKGLQPAARRAAAAPNSIGRRAMLADV